MQRYVDMSQLNQRWHNALPLTGLGDPSGMVRRGGGIFGPNVLGSALGSYYDGKFDGLIRSSLNASAQAQQNASLAKAQKDAKTAIPLVRAAFDFCSQAQAYAGQAGDDLSATEWSGASGAVDQGVAAAQVQDAFKKANAACNAANSAEVYVASLPKPPLPAAYTDALAAAEHEGTLASQLAHQSIQTNDKPHALELAQQAYPHCDAGMSYLMAAKAVFDSIDWDTAVYDEEDAINRGNHAYGVVTQGCSDVAAAYGHVQSIPGGEIPDIPPVHTCPPGQVWDGHAGRCVAGFPSTPECPEGQEWSSQYGACMWKPGGGQTSEAGMWILGLGAALALGGVAWALTRKKGRG